MTIETSAQYKADLKIKRTFAEITESLQSVEKQIASLIELGASMRRTVGTALLNLSHVEALFVDNCHNRRNAEAQLDEVKQRLADLTGSSGAKLEAAVKSHQLAVYGLSAVQATTERIATDRYVKDTEKGTPVPGVDYVGVEYFLAELAISRKVFDRMFQAGEIAEHDAVDEGGQGRPKFLWLKHKAAANVVRVRGKTAPKKGIAALV